MTTSSIENEASPTSSSKDEEMNENYIEEDVDNNNKNETNKDNDDDDTDNSALPSAGITKEEKLTPRSSPVPPEMIVGFGNRNNNKSDNYSPSTLYTNNTVEDDDDEDDEELREAKAYARAIQNNPNITKEEIQQLQQSLSPRSSTIQQQRLLPEEKQKHALANASLISGDIFTSLKLDKLKLDDIKEDIRHKSELAKKQLQEFGDTVSEYIAEKQLVQVPKATTTTAAAVVNTSVGLSTSANQQKQQQQQHHQRSKSTGGMDNLSVVHENSVQENIDTQSLSSSSSSPLKPSSSVSQSSKTAAAAAATTTTGAPLSSSSSLHAVGGQENIQPILDDILWREKRVSGPFGKLQFKNGWERGRVVLIGTKVMYYNATTTTATTATAATGTSTTSSTMAGNITGSGDISPLEKQNQQQVEKQQLDVDDDDDDDGNNNNNKTKTTTVSTFSSSWVEKAAANFEETKAKIMGTTTTTSSEDNNKPYGVLDLVKDRAKVAASRPSDIKNAPTPFVISIKLDKFVGTTDETTLRLYFDSFPIQMKWLSALTEIIVTSSVDKYNKALVNAADPNQVSLLPQVQKTLLQDTHTIIDTIINTPTTAANNAVVTVLPTTTTTSTSTSNSKDVDNSISSSTSISQQQQMQPSTTGGQSKASNVDSSTTATSSMLNESSIHRPDGSGHRLWIMEPYKIQSLDHDSNELDNNIQEDDEKTKSSLSGYSSSWNLNSDHLYPIIASINILLFSSRYINMLFWLLVMSFNIMLWYLLEKGTIQIIYKKDEDKLKSSSIIDKDDHDDKHSTISKQAQQEQEKQQKIVSRPVIKPIAGSTAIRIPNNINIHSKTDVLEAASKNGKNKNLVAWCNPPSGMCEVRSYNYLSSKKKVPSPNELYECIHVDVFEASKTYPDMASRVTLPPNLLSSISNNNNNSDNSDKTDNKDDNNTIDTDESEKINDSATNTDSNNDVTATTTAATCNNSNNNKPIDKTWHAPDIFIISISLPTDPPKLGGSGDDGGGYVITMYLKMKKETLDILKRITAPDYNKNNDVSGNDGNNEEKKNKNQVNAVNLFNEFCKRAPSDPTFMSRMKFIPMGNNLKEIGMPSYIAKYNGKPLLIKRPGKTGFLYDHRKREADVPTTNNNVAVVGDADVMEFDLSLHPFPYFAKQAFSYMKDKYFKDMVASFAFLVEGRSEDELPECIIGQTQICYPDPMTSIKGIDFFSGATSPYTY